jgi:hypothetical protein
MLSSRIHSCFDVSLTQVKGINGLQERSSFVIFAVQHLPVRSDGLFLRRSLWYNHRKVWYMWSPHRSV